MAIKAFWEMASDLLLGWDERYDMELDGKMNGLKRVFLFFQSFGKTLHIVSYMSNCFWILLAHFWLAFCFHTGKKLALVRELRC